MEEQIRQILPEKARQAFDDIVEQRVLGASKHIAMIGEMFEAIADRGLQEHKKPADIIEEIKKVADYFIATRGEASQAVSNAILLMTHNIDQYSNLELSEAVRKILETKNAYARTAKESVDACVSYGVKLAEPMNRIFVYDYSSTVEKFLRSLQKNNKPYEIYIAESRVIDGGKPFVRACQESGYKIKFIPEASMMYYLKDCDGAFMGAENLLSGWNGI